MAGLEIAGMTLATVDAVVQLLAAIKFRQDSHKKIPGLIDSAEWRVLRIRKAMLTYSALCERTSLPGEVFDRVVEDFDSIKAELVDIQVKISSGSKFKNWLSSPAFFDSLSTTLSRLGPLEIHLDLYGLMSYREGTIASCFSDLSSSIQRLSDDVSLDLQHNLNAMMCKIDAIFERLGLGTIETMNIGRSATSTDTFEYTVDEVETLSLSEFSSLSSKARELLEMLASSGISSGDKKDLGEKIRHIWSGWRVRIEDVEFETTKGGFEKCLGEGGFSSVYRGRLIRRSSNGEREGEALLVAFKHLKIEEHELPGRRADFLRELFLQLDIDHPCVLKTYGGFWPEIEGGDKVTDSAKGVLDDDDDYTPPYIVTERMTCNVAKAVRWNLLRYGGNQKRVIIDVAEGLAHLHGRGVVHRDIKPENILLRLKKNGELIGNAKICDFGMSRRVQNAQLDTMCSTTGGPCGTIAYMPPEVLCNFRNYPSRKSWDVWSFGVLICYIVVAECRTELGKLRPFKAESIAKSGELATMMQMLASKIPDPVLREVAKMCLLRKEAGRPGMHRVVHMLRGTDIANVDIPEIDGKRNEKRDFSACRLPVIFESWMQAAAEQSGFSKQDFVRHASQWAEEVGIEPPPWRGGRTTRAGARLPTLGNADFPGGALSPAGGGAGGKPRRQVPVRIRGIKTAVLIEPSADAAKGCARTAGTGAFRFGTSDAAVHEAVQDARRERVASFSRGRQPPLKVGGHGCALLLRRRRCDDLRLALTNSANCGFFLSASGNDFGCPALLSEHPSPTAA